MRNAAASFFSADAPAAPVATDPASTSLPETAAVGAGTEAFAALVDDALERATQGGSESGVAQVFRFSGFQVEGFAGGQLKIPAPTPAPANPAVLALLSESPDTSGESISAREGGETEDTLKKNEPT